MKITKVEPIFLKIPFENGGSRAARGGTGEAWERMEILLVRVETDEGVTGWGESHGFAISPVTAFMLREIFAPLCVGQTIDPMETFLSDLRRKTHSYGTSGPNKYAYSGIEIALWDIAGKRLGKPLHELLGGAKRKRVPAYASLLRYASLDEVERNVAAALERGYDAVKLHEKSVEAVASGRRVAGPGVPLMLDVNCAWTLEEATRMAKAFEPHDLAWLEEPLISPDDLEGLVQLRDRTSIPIAAGENIGSVRGIIHAIEYEALEIVQPSVTKIGGIGEWRKAVAEINAAGLRLQPHSPHSGPGLIATLHLLAAMEPEIRIERFYLDLEASPIGDVVVPVDGAMRVPDGPGLGFEVDERIVDRYRAG